MLKAFIRAFKTPDLRKKLVFTLAIMAIFRLGSHIPTPGVSYVDIQKCRPRTGAAGGVLGFANDGVYFGQFIYFKFITNSSFRWRTSFILRG